MIFCWICVKTWANMTGAGWLCGVQWTEEKTSLNGSVRMDCITLCTQHGNICINITKINTFDLKTRKSTQRAQTSTQQLISTHTVISTQCSYIHAANVGDLYFTQVYCCGRTSDCTVRFTPQYFDPSSRSFFHRCGDHTYVSCFITYI